MVGHPVVVRADHDEGRLVEVADAVALAKELRAHGGAHRPVVRGLLSREPGRDQRGAGARRHGAAHHDRVATALRGPAQLHRPPDVAERPVDVREIGAASRCRRRAHTDQGGVGPADRGFGLRGGAEETGLDRGGDQRLQTRLQDGAAAPVDRVDLARIDVDAHHLVPARGETGGSDCAYVPETENCDLHERIPTRVRPPV
jgi:hypothetical protein